MAQKDKLVLEKINLIMERKIQNKNIDLRLEREKEIKLQQGIFNMDSDRSFGKSQLAKDCSPRVTKIYQSPA